jgi:TetR/AcrR family transcriptional regulator
MRAYADAQDAHRVLTEDVKFLPDAARDVVLAGERRVVAAFADAIADARPGLDRSMHKPLAMLLFGMINWTFTWLRPAGRLSHEALAPVVADLFLGGLGAVHGPAPEATRRRTKARAG